MAQINRKGKILKALSGFYYVYDGETEYECKARGILRKQNIKPVTGDDVIISIDPSDSAKGHIEEVLERKNILIRPPVANVDQALITFSVVHPKIDYILLDKLLILSEKNNVIPVICITKKDLDEENIIFDIKRKYSETGYKILYLSKYEEESLYELKNVLSNKISLLTGPSGVGKSTMINSILPESYIETGEISIKLKRGRHTTRHSQIHVINKNEGIIDSAGFSSLELDNITKDELQNYYPEFNKDRIECRFNNCLHNHEPGCIIKEMVSKNQIPEERYKSYLYFLNIL